MNRRRPGRGGWLLAVVWLVALGGCKTGEGKADLDEKPAITANNSAAQRRFDHAVELLRTGRYDQARQAFRLLQAEFSDDPIASVAELYVARADMGQIRLGQSFAAAATGTYDESAEAARILASLANSTDVDTRIRYGAAAYRALELSLRGQTDKALAALKSHPGGALSNVVLESDRAPTQALLTESLYRAGRYRTTMVAASRLHNQLARRMNDGDAAGLQGDLLGAEGRSQTDGAAGSAADSLQSLDALARDRAFGAASAGVDVEVLGEYSTGDGPLLRAAAGWGLLVGQLHKSINDQQRAALEDLFNRIAPDLIEVGAAERAAEISTRLAAVGGPKRLAIGFLLPLSGTHKAVGRRAMAGALVAMRAFHHSGQPEVTVVFQDSRADVQIAFDQLRDQQVLAIMGPLDVERARQFAPLAREAKIPIITLAAEPVDGSAGDQRRGGAADQSASSQKPASAPQARAANATSSADKPTANAPGGSGEPTHFVFRNFIDAEAEAKAAAEVAFNEIGDRKAAVVYPDVGYGRISSEAFATQFRALGGQVVLATAYDRSRSDFENVARKVAKAGPEAIFLPDSASKVAEVTAFMANENIWGLPAGQPRSTRSHRRQVHYLGTSLWEQSILVRQAANYVQGAAVPVWFSPAIDDPKVDQFVERFQAVYGYQPDKFEAFSYDTVNWLRSVLVQRGMRRPVAVGDALVAGDRHHGVTGAVQMTPDGEPRRVLRFVTPTADGFEPLPFSAVTGPAAPPASSSGSDTRGRSTNSTGSADSATQSSAQPPPDTLPTE